MTTDTFEYCDTHCDMWEPGCERCEVCSQHHNQMDVETWLAIIDRRAHPPDGGPKTHGLITIDTNQYDKFQMQADRIKELEIALIGTDDALFWLLNLLHGNSKGGPDFSPPNNAEWEGAIGQGKEAHEIAEKALGGDA